VKITDRQKKLAAVGVGGLLFLVFMLARQRNAANTTAADGSTIPTATGGGAGQSDFSGDTSGALGAASNDLTGALSGISSGLDTLGSNEGVLYDRLGDLATGLGGLTTAQATQQASIDRLGGQLSDLTDRTPATDGNPGLGDPIPGQGAAPATAAAAIKTKTVVKNGRVYHFTDTDPKKAGYERKVYVRPASTARRSPSTPHPKTPKAPAKHHTTPAAKHHPAPKRKPAPKKKTRR
jgi:hypothetical protein